MNIGFDAECSDNDYDTTPSDDDPQKPMRLMVRADLEDLAGTLLNLRALRAFSRAPVRYPIHRVVRCAARGAMADLFDDLALRNDSTPARCCSTDPECSRRLMDGPRRDTPHVPSHSGRILRSALAASKNSCWQS